MKFSVVINTYNRAKYLENTLSSLAYQTHQDFEVVIVNGPSTDHTLEVLNKYNHFIKVLSCPTGNLSISRNIGIKHASGEIIAFLDDDAIPIPRWLAALESGYNNPKIGGVGGFIRDHTGKDFQSEVVVCDRFGNSVNYQNEESANIVHVPGVEKYYSLTGCNSSFRRDVLFEIGGFDEEFAYFLDETDVCLRVVDAGYKLSYISSAQVLHKYAESYLRNHEKIPTSLYLSPKSKAYFCMKHMQNQNLKAVNSELKKYKNNLHKDKKNLLKAGKITVTHYKQLLEDIDRGIEDGITRAIRNPAGQHGLRNFVKNNEHNFVPFKQLENFTNKRMKLCFCSREYPPGTVGGIGIWTAEVAEGLAAKGHEVSVICLSTKDHATVDYNNGVWVHRIIPKLNPCRKLPQLPDLPQVIKDYTYSVYDEVLNIKLLRGVDLVSFPIWDLEGIACFLSDHINVVMSLHTTYALALPSKSEWCERKQFKKNHLDKIIEAEKNILSSNISLLANSKQIVSDIEQSYQIKIKENKLSQIPHGLKDYRNLYVSNVVDMKQKEISILFVGRFEARKGVDLLLNIIPKVLEIYSHVKFTLVGDDTILENGKNYKKDFLEKHRSQDWLNRVDFKGAVSEELLFQEYAKCDFLVAPSRYESFGLIFVEAAIYGKPSVAPDIGGVKEVILDQVNGLLFEAGNELSLQKAISKLIENPLLIEGLSKKSREIYEQKFTANKMINSIENFMKQEVAMKSHSSNKKNIGFAN